MSIRRLFDLSDRVAIVTGGSRGLGLQMAETLGELGARVAITARKAPELEEAADRLRSQGVAVLTIPGDLSSESAATLLVDQVLANWERIDVLINNAGATWGAPAEDHPLDAWQKVINLNLTATFVLTQAVGRKAMIPRRSGKIVNIASVAGLNGTHPGFMRTLAYNTSKGGLVNFTRSLAAEWAQYNINVNAIAPGVFPSKMSRGMIERGQEIILNLTPLKRFGGDEDLKGVTALLASDASSYITGQIIAVDGGMSAI